MLRTRIKPISKRRASENRIYLKLRKEYLAAHSTCTAFGCKNLAREIHHMMGRVGWRFLAVQYWMAVCQACHYLITNDPSLALQRGYTLPRSDKPC